MMISEIVTAPCKDCTERSVGCHSACERYREYKDTLDKNRADIAAKYAEFDFIVSVKREVQKRGRMKKRKDRRR